MKIISVVNLFFPSIGGMQVASHVTFQALGELGCDVRVIAPVAELSQDKLPCNYTVTGHAKEGYQGSISRLIFLNKLLKRKDYKGAVVLLIGREVEIAYSLLKWMFKGYSVYFISSGTAYGIKNNILKRLLRDALLKRTYRSPAHFVAITEETREQLCPLVSSEGKIKVIPHPIDEDHWLPSISKKIDPNNIKLVSYARLEKAKNIQGVLLILKNLKDQGISNWTYTVIGCGGYLRNLKNISKSYDLDENVIFLGEINYHFLPAVIATMDISIMLSLYRETFCLTYIESSALGIMSLGYNGGATQYTLKNDVNGYIFDESDALSVENKLKFLLKNPDVVLELGKRSRQFYLENYTKKIVGSTLISLFNETNV